jgi:putative glutamine amidotransferase
MHRPQIGISLTLDDRERWREGRAYHYIDRSYADAISSAGGIALQLPIQTDPAALVDSLDGLLLPGGGDFPADGDSPDEMSDEMPDEMPDERVLDLVSPEQLAFDEALFEAASNRAIPILGICYGMQLMARMRKGVLDTHLPSQRPDVDCHKLPPDARHPIRIEPDSQLASIIGSETSEVNSLHQQAVRRVGPMHRAVAHSSDGVIEAIEGSSTRSGTWEIGVQWHPEKMAEISGRRLFHAFVEACRESGNES